MDLEDVRVFTEVVQAGSFTAAGKKLGMPKSTVSRRVSALEESLGARLLHRTTRKLSLTDAGSTYFGHSARVMELLSRAEQEVSELQARPRGLLRVTAPADWAMAAWLADFCDRYPEVDVELFATGRRVDLVAEGYDLALRAGRLTDSSMVARKLVTSNFSLFASRTYLERHGTPQCLQDLSEHQCLIFGQEGPRQVWVLQGPRGPEQVAVHGRVSTNDLAMLRELTASHMGIARLPTFALAPSWPKEDLVEVLSDYESEGGALYAVYPSAQHLTPKVRAFIDFVAERFAAGGDHPAFRRSPT